MISGKRIRAARRARGLTLRAVGDAVGVSHVFVSKVEHDERHVPSARRAAFASLLGVSVADLTPLDPETLGAVAAHLREAGGCDRAVAIVEEMRKGRAA